MLNTERLLKTLRLRRSKAEDEAEGIHNKLSNDYHYKQGLADGIEIAEMIVKKVDKEEREEQGG